MSPSIGLAAVIAALGAVGWLGPFLQTETNASREGLSAYESGDWVGAMTRFQEGRDVSENHGLFDFNLGTAALQAGEFEIATQRLGASLGAETLPEGAAAYNLGNALAESGNLEQALEAYRDALRTNPEDDDARANYEITQARLDQQQEQEQQEQDDSQDQEENEEGEDQEGDDQENQDQQGEQEQEQPDENQEKDPQDSEDQDPSQSEQPPDAPQDSTQAQPQPMDPEQMLTPEQAERLLNAVSPKERELIRARLQPTKRRKAEKDW